MGAAARPPPLLQALALPGSRRRKTRAGGGPGPAGKRAVFVPACWCADCLGIGAQHKANVRQGDDRQQAPLCRRAWCGQFCALALAEVGHGAAPFFSRRESFSFFSRYATTQEDIQDVQCHSRRGRRLCRPHSRH
ncbi:hypothetical protein SDC9_05736 [bioreactor metagenome]|uniref:Uncharacterized protein n=1 Tax=bioreactor metagenome TaxID=1076179 RepID=A0A644T038_9ZZZZ